VHKLFITYNKKENGLIDININQYTITIEDVLDIGFIINNISDLDIASSNYPLLYQYRPFFLNNSKSIPISSLISVLSILFTTDPEEISCYEYYKKSIRNILA